MPKQSDNRLKCSFCGKGQDQVKKLIKLLETEGVGYDLGAYKDAPAGLRIWCGATVERADLQALLPWLTWGYAQVTQA